MKERLKISAALAVVALIIGLVAWRTKDRIYISDRFWVYEVKVMYTQCKMVTVTKPIQQCHRVNNVQRCNTTYRTETRQECTSHTRCTSSNAGRELPTVRSEPGCHMYSGDHLNENTAYMAEFTIDDRTITRAFKQTLWDSMKPGTYREVQRNVLGNIIGLEEE